MSNLDVVYHLAVSTRRGQLAWTRWDQGVELFVRVSRALGDSLVALCIMPDHVHPLATRDVRVELRAALSGYTRWLQHRIGGRGPLFRPIEPPVVRRSAQKILRDQRYVELNPCRDELVVDPLAWPLSTWRDRLGLAWPPVRDRVNDPARWYEYATRDDYVKAQGLPARTGLRDPDDVEAAVSSLCRCPLPLLYRRGPARNLYVAGLHQLTDLSGAQIARHVGMSARRVRDLRDHPALPILDRVAGDPRFAPLHPDDLSRTPAWRQYRQRNRRAPLDERWL